MTILYMAERTVDSTDFADWLREDDDYIAFVQTALEVEEWASNSDDIVAVLFEKEFEQEVKRLKGRFVAIERKPELDGDDILALIKHAVQNLSTRK